MRFAVLGLAAALVAACAANGRPPAFDRSAGPVADFAEILPEAAEAALDGELRRYFDSTGNSLVVTSVVPLAGRPIEEVSLETARRRGIGDADTQRGLMIMVAPSDRKIRIEVACGLESIITDERAQAIIDDTMLPRFRAGEIEQGTIAGVRALMQATEEYRSDLGKRPHSPGCLKEAA